MFPFNNYKKVSFGPIASEAGVTVYTTTSLSLIYFIPYGPYMEDDTPIEVYVNNYFTDSDGGVAAIWLYRSYAPLNNQLFLNFAGLGHVNVPVIVPAGKNVIARVGDNSDKIGGTLYILELPE